MSKKKIVARIVRRTEQQIYGCKMHDQRAGGDLKHVDPERTHLNRNAIDPDTGRAIGTEDVARDFRDLVEQIADENLRNELEGLKKSRGRKAVDAREADGPKKPWHESTQKPWTEIILTASPEYFRDEGQGPGEWIEERLHAFENAVVRSMKRRFGRGLVSMRLHLDEETPHYHCVVLPIVERKSKRRGRQLESSHRNHPEFWTEAIDKRQLETLTGKARSDKAKQLRDELIKGYERFQDGIADDVAQLCIERGEKRAEARRNGDGSVDQVEHKTTAEWSAELSKKMSELTTATEHYESEAAKCEVATQKANEKGEKAEIRGQSAAKSEAKSRSLIDGIVALANGELCLRKEPDSGELRIGFGQAAPSDKDARKQLNEAIKPSFSILTTVAKFLEEIVQKRVREYVQRLRGEEDAVAKKEEELARRERDVEQKDADVSQQERALLRDLTVFRMARQTLGLPVPEEVEDIYKKRDETVRRSRQDRER